MHELYEVEVYARHARRAVSFHEYRRHKLFRFELLYLIIFVVQTGVPR